MKKWFVVMLAATVALSACSKKKAEDESTLPSAANADENMMGDSDSGKAMGLQTVHFGYDAYTLDDSAKNVLKNNAQIMKDKASAKIQIEGHCDQRGGIQYNIALGEKRANAAKKFMVDQGIKAERISTISMGKEKPVDNGTTEDAYAKNRRGNFVVTSR
ncbi:MAG: OmpA family protein [Bdellovibrionales bacterium]|nr:OmpA family protein [Bdellovibrionales bacterium]